MPCAHEALASVRYLKRQIFIVPVASLGQTIMASMRTTLVQHPVWPVVATWAT